MKAAIRPSWEQAHANRILLLQPQGLKSCSNPSVATSSPKLCDCNFIGFSFPRPQFLKSLHRCHGIAVALVGWGRDHFRSRCKWFRTDGNRFEPLPLRIQKSDPIRTQRSARIRVLLLPHVPWSPLGVCQRIVVRRHARPVRAQCALSKLGPLTSSGGE